MTYDHDWTPEQHTEVARVNADLVWWEAAFGEGNVAGWTYKHSAAVDWAGKRRAVDASIRNWIVDNIKTAHDPNVKCIGLPEEVWDAAEKLALDATMSVDGILLQALRLYQMHVQRLSDGETRTYSGDAARRLEFARRKSFDPYKPITSAQRRFMSENREYYFVGRMDNDGPYYSEHFKEICILRADGTQQLLEVGDSLRVGKRQRLIGIPFDC